MDLILSPGICLEPDDSLILAADWPLEIEMRAGEISFANREGGLDGGTNVLLFAVGFTGCPRGDGARLGRGETALEDRVTGDPSADGGREGEREERRRPAVASGAASVEEGPPRLDGLSFPGDLR